MGFLVRVHYAVCVLFCVSVRGPDSLPVDLLDRMFCRSHGPIPCQVAMGVFSSRLTALCARRLETGRYRCYVRQSQCRCLFNGVVAAIRTIPVDRSKRVHVHLVRAMEEDVFVWVACVRRLGDFVDYSDLQPIGHAGVHPVCTSRSDSRKVWGKGVDASCLRSDAAGCYLAVDARGCPRSVKQTCGTPRRDRKQRRPECPARDGKRD